MSHYLRQLARETHARLAPPSALRLGPLAPARFEEVYEERSAPALRTHDAVKPPAITAQQQLPPAAPPQQLPPVAPPPRTNQPANETRRSAPAPARPPAPPTHEAPPSPALTPTPTVPTDAAVTWEFLQEISDTFVRPNGVPIEPAANITRNIAPEPNRPPRRLNPEPVRTTQAQFDVTIGRIDVIIEAEPQPAVRTQRREPRAISPAKPAPLSATGRLARQYLDR